MDYVVDTEDFLVIINYFIFDSLKELMLSVRQVCRGIPAPFSHTATSIVLLGLETGKSTVIPR